MKKPDKKRWQFTIYRTKETEAVVAEIEQRLLELTGIKMTQSQIFRRALDVYLESLQEKETARRTP